MKFYKWLFIFAGIITILNLGGFTTNSGGIVEQLLNGGLTSFKSTNLYTLVLAVFILAGTAGGIIIGAITRSSPIEYIIAALVSFLFSAMMADVIGIFITIWGFGIGWIQGIASLIFVPLVFAFTASFVDWWRGSDS